MVRFDPANGAVLATIPGFTFSMTEAAGSIWIADYDTGEVKRVDPATNTVVAATKITPEKAWGVFSIGDHVWASAYGKGAVVVIDPETNAIVATVGGIGLPTQIVEAGGKVYVRAAGSLVQIDPTT